ncbi:MAG: hypothetical protein WEB06_19510 [Actinomycetota bacterium]
MTHVLAGSRTARLLNHVFFDGEADEAKISDGLRATRVRLVADSANVATRAGQAAVVTTFQLVARMGIGIELLVADVPLVTIVQPLRRPTLAAALLELGSDLIPDTIASTEAVHSHVTLAFGDTTSATDAIVVEADELSCRLTISGSREPTRISSDCPLGAMAAAAAAAAIALQGALPQIESATGRRMTTRPRPPAGPPVEIDLRVLFPDIEVGAHRFGCIDAISGGAVTNSLLHTLLWLPQVTAGVRVIEREPADLTNLNRYTQLRASDDTRLKIDVLAEGTTNDVTITGVEALFTAETREAILPLAEHVMVGVDRIEARWWVQQEWPAHLYIGATDNESAVLTTHQPSQPCAGCAHPDPLPPLDPDDFIPTISVVSFWGGFLQALALLTPPGLARRLTVFPFALGGEWWFHTSELPEGARCPVGCDASRGAEAA